MKAQNDNPKPEKQEETFPFTFNLSREALHNLLYVAYTRKISKEKALNQILKKAKMIPVIPMASSNPEEYLKKDQALHEKIEEHIDALLKSK